MADGKCSKVQDPKDKKELTVLQAVNIVKECFERNAKKDGDAATMTKEELSYLLRNQFDIVSQNIKNVVFPEL